MAIPASPRVLYSKNPLAQVICQLRFPAILRIETAPPALFQEKIQRQFPIYREKSEVRSLPAGLAEQLPPDIADSLIGSRLSAYEFLSADQNWILSLTRGFLALTTRKYERWEDFKDHLVEPVRALQAIYTPAFYSRIGLRYQNVICRSRLGLTDVRWSELLNPHVAGLLSTNEISATIQETTHVTIFTLPNFEAKVRLQDGFAVNEADSDKEVCYLLDSDLFTEQQIGDQNVYQILDYFNEQNRHLFRWSISSKLHEAMEPQAIGARSTSH